MAQRLLMKLRSDITYLVVVQYADGVYLKRVLSVRRFVRNMLVLSAGGSGHVPIPLLSRPMEFISTPEFGAHDYHMSFVGSRRDGVRKTALAKVKEASEFISGFRFHSAEFVDSTEFWVDIMRRSQLQLAPRGTGLTSFRLYEALQLGLIPVYVYDTPWLPYRPPQTGVFDAPPHSVWDDIAYVVKVENLWAWTLDVLPRVMTDAARYSVMKERIREVKETHFSYAAVMRHIHRFIAHPPAAELQCVERQGM